MYIRNKETIKTAFSKGYNAFCAVYALFVCILFTYVSVLLYIYYSYYLINYIVY
jgi:Na+/alanine symporter